MFRCELNLSLGKCNKFLGKVVENISYIQKDQFLRVHRTSPPPLNNVGKTEHSPPLGQVYSAHKFDILGGEGEGFDFSNFALLVPRLLCGSNTMEHVSSR